MNFFCLTAFVVAISVLLFPCFAMAGSISGRVKVTASGEPIYPLMVSIMDNYLDFQASTTTDINGDYIFENLPAGQYLVKTSTGDSGYVAEFFQSALNYHTAALIDLEENQELSGIDIQLETGQNISGRITDRDTNLPVSGVTVYALPEETLQYPWHEIWEDTNMMVSCFGYGGLCKTNPGGHYIIKGIPPGRYFVGAEAGHENGLPYTPAYFGESLSPFLATLVPVTETEGAVDIDIALETGGIIGGAVTDPNGRGVEGVMVIMERVLSYIYGIEESDLMMKARTDPDGRYLAPGLPQGNYKVYLSKYSLNPYLASPPGSDLYQILKKKIVKGAVIEDCDFILKQPAGKITGTVRSKLDGSPVRGVSVTLISYNEYSSFAYPAFLYGYGNNYWPDYGVGESFTDITGQYTLSGMGMGTYLVRASSDSFLRGHLNRFVNRAYNVSGRKASITLLPPYEISGIDLYLSPGGSISGTVLNRSDGSPIQGIQVRAYNKSVFGEDPIIKCSNYTDSEGRYRIEGLDQGSYIVYIGEDPRIVTFSPTPLPYPFLTSSGYIDVSGPRSTTSYDSGNYSYSGEYIPDSYRSNYWQVSVVPPEYIQGIDFELVRGGAISGFVFAEDSGGPLASAEVRASIIPGTADQIYSTRTDMNGFYELKGLHGDEYQLEALDQKGRYLRSDMRLVKVKEGETLTDQNFSLKLGGSISGTITDETDGLPIPNVVVSALQFCEKGRDIPYSGPEGILTNGESFDYYYPAESGLFFPYPPYGAYGGPYGGLWNRGVWNPGIFPVTDADGKYTITGLPPGEYRVTCSDPGGIYTSEHYQDTPSIYPYINMDNTVFTRLEKDLDYIGDIHPYFQIRYQVINLFRIHLLLKDKNGSEVPVLIRLGSENRAMDGIYLGPEPCFASAIGSGNTIESIHYNDRGTWGMLQIDPEDLLAEYFSSPCYYGDQGVSSNGLDAIIRIGLEGNGYRMDYIRLVRDENGGQISYTEIDGFNYPEPPTDHGWQITSSISPHITMLSGDYMEGGGGIMVLAETPVLVTEGDQMSGIDMALSKGGRVSGRVTDFADSNPVSGISIRLFRIDYQPGSQYSTYETITDKNGEYTIGGLAEGVYTVLARHKNNGPYLHQWYENVQMHFNEYNQDYNYGYTDHILSAIIRRPDLTGFTNHNLEFMTMTTSPFTLSLDVRTISGEQARIKFCRIGENRISIVKTRISNTILVPLSDESYKQGLWKRFRYDLNGILEEHSLTQLDRVLGIELEGGVYLIDDIRLIKEGQEDQVIDDFDYTDSPLNHGWVSDSSPGFAKIHNPDLGHPCLLITSASPVYVGNGSDIDGIDFSLRLAGGISGNVLSAQDSSPVPGIRLKAILCKLGLTYYDYDNYYGTFLRDEGIISDSTGSYIIPGLIPGQYRVQALDMDSLFAPSLFRDIPMIHTPTSAAWSILDYASDNLTSITKDLTPLNITNPKLHVDLIFHDKFAFRVKVEATDGTVMQLNFHTGYSTSDYWYKDMDESPDIPAFTVSLKRETAYNAHRLNEDRWESWETSLNDIIGSEFSKTMKRVKEVRMIGNYYRIASIKFLKEGEVDQSADNFDYPDSPVNHDWVIDKPETTNPVMIWDTLIEKMTLDCSPARLISVEEGMITEGIDFNLMVANRITGRITDAADGTPLAGIYVSTYNLQSYQSLFDAYTDQNGCYSLFISGSHNPLNYTINAADWRQGIYPDVSYPNSIELSTGMEVSGIDMAMEKGGCVTGRVTYADTNTAAEGAFVECLAPDSPSSTYPRTIISGRTGPDGNYRLAGIPEGGYVIYAMSRDFKHEGYYRDNRDCLDPPVICESGEETAGIDIRLNPIKDEDTYSEPYKEIHYSSLPQPGHILGGASTPYGLNFWLSPSYNISSLDVPTITSLPTFFASVGVIYSYHITLLDPNLWTDINCYLTEAPPGMDLNNQARLIIWTPSLNQVGEHAVKIEINASNVGNAGGVAGQGFTISVLPYMIIESAEGDASPLLNGEWDIMQGTGTFTDTNDPQIQSQVLLTQADEPDPLDFRIGYPIAYSLQNSRPYLSFAVKSDNDFRFCGRVKAGEEEYVLQYAPIDGNLVISGNSVVYPIGTEYLNGQWHLCKRDLQKDLEPFGVTFEWVNHFEIWGECSMDDLWLSYQPVDYQIFSIRLYRGLNLISLPIRSEDMDSEDLAQLCTGDRDTSYIRRRNAFLQQWEEEFDPVRGDQGFVIYSHQEKWVTLKGTQKELDIETIASYLKPGINLVSPPSLQGKGYNSTDILNTLKSSNLKVLCIHTYDRRKGTWLTNSPFFNRTTGPFFEIQPAEGYLVGTYLVETE